MPPRRYTKKSRRAKKGGTRPHNSKRRRTKSKNSKRSKRKR